MPHLRVLPSPDLERVLALPRRDPAPDPRAVALGTEHFRRTGGRKDLFPEQAMALLELGRCRGLFGSLAVGSGKTLISLLATKAAGAKRPVLMLPAKLRKRTPGLADQYGKDWDVTLPTLLTYTEMSRHDRADLLYQLKPDLIVLDEAHKARNRRTAVARRLARYLKSNPDTVVVVLSGTVVSDSLLGFSHLMAWSLGEGSPLPLVTAQAEAWGAALDPGDSPAQLGALSALLSGGQDLTRENVRKALHRRMVETPGVRATVDLLDTVPLTIQILQQALPKALRSPVAALLEKHEDEHGVPLTPEEVTSSIASLAYGVGRAWNPAPTEAYRKAKKRWLSFTQSRQARSMCDTPDQAARAVKTGRLRDPERRLETWRRERDTSRAATVATRVCSEVVETIADWLTCRAGVAFVADRELGRWAAELAGVPYFGQGGLCREGPYAGRTVEEFAPSRRPCVLSLWSSYEGRDGLQVYDHALVVGPPSRGGTWEQLLGRLHRVGQTSGVTYDVLCTHPVHVEALTSAVESAKEDETLSGQPQKILHARRES